MYVGNTDLFEILSGIVSLIIAIRAFWLFAQFRGYRLFILGLSMLLFSLTTIAGIARNAQLIPLAFSTTWFSFVGQTGAFLFLFLSSLRGTDGYLRSLIRWQIITSVPMAWLLVISPVLPQVSDPFIKALFIASRALVCFLTFYSYVALFMKKETRFSFLMMVAFLALTFGYVGIIPRFFLPQAAILTLVGDMLRVIGLIALAFGFLGG